MSDNYTIQDLGGASVAKAYPDRGLIPESSYFNSIVKTQPQVKGFWSWLGSIKHCNSFLAVLSANDEGLRIVVSLDDFRIFIPWSEISISGERGWPATIVQLRTTAVPSLAIVLNLDDNAADELFRHPGLVLPRRDPPRGHAWWILDTPHWVVWLALLVCAGIVLFANYVWSGR
jgi:hypothetical protein